MAEEINYHLAAALARNGEVEEARRLLENVLREGGDFASREQAEELLLQL